MNWTDLLFYLGWLALAPCFLIGVWRVSVGPTTLDRMVGFDLLTIGVVAAMIGLSVYQGTADYMELIIIVTALSFFSTVAFFYYLSHLPAVDGGLTMKEKND